MFLKRQLVLKFTPDHKCNSYTRCARKKTGLKSQIIYVKSQLQNYKFCHLKLSLSCLTHFPIFLCHAPMHSWILRSSLVTAFLMVSTSAKKVPLMTPLNLGKRKKNRTKLGRLTIEVSTAQRCSSCQEPSRCSGRCDTACRRREATKNCLATPLVSSYAQNEAYLTGFPCRYAVHLAMRQDLLTWPLPSKKAINMSVTLDSNCLDFINIGVYGLFQ